LDQSRRFRYFHSLCTLDFLTVQGVSYRVEFRNVPGRTEKTNHEAYISCILITVYYRNEFCCVHTFNLKQTLIVEITAIVVETVFVHPMKLVFVMLDGAEKIVPYVNRIFTEISNINSTSSSLSRELLWKRILLCSK
jgi:hypothetical protein